ADALGSGVGRFGSLFLGLLAASIEAHRGRLEAYSLEETAFQHRDRSMLHLLTEVAAGTKDAALAARIEQELRGVSDQWISYGAYGMLAGGPVISDLGLTLATQGRAAEARVCYSQALTQARAAGARLAATWVHWRQLQLAIQTDDLGLWNEEMAQLRHAADDLALPGLTQALATLARPHATLALNETASPHLESAPPPSMAPREGFTLTRVGESWQARCGDREFLLVDTKGVRLLARLVEEPGREHHVLSLSTDTGEMAPGSRSDAG